MLPARRSGAAKGMRFNAQARVPPPDNNSGAQTGYSSSGMTFKAKWRGGGAAQYMIAASSAVLSRSTGPTLVVTLSWIWGCSLANRKSRGNSQIFPSETGTDRLSSATGGATRLHLKRRFLKHG